MLNYVYVMAGGALGRARGFGLRELWRGGLANFSPSAPYGERHWVVYYRLLRHAH